MSLYNILVDTLADMGLADLLQLKGSHRFLLSTGMHIARGTVFMMLDNSGNETAEKLSKASQTTYSVLFVQKAIYPYVQKVLAGAGITQPHTVFAVSLLIAYILVASKDNKALEDILEKAKEAVK